MICAGSPRPRPSTGRPSPSRSNDCAKRGLFSARLAPARRRRPPARRSAAPKAQPATSSTGCGAAADKPQCSATEAGQHASVPGGAAERVPVNSCAPRRAQPKEVHMADRVSASIIVGGTLNAAEFDELVDIIASERLAIEWDGEPFEAHHHVAGEPLSLFAHEVAGGSFDDLESWCLSHRLPFV